MNDTMQTFEKFYLARKQFPKFFPIESSDSSLERSMEVFRSGYCYPLSERDEEGCRVVLIQIKRLNTELYSIFDGIRLSILVMAVIMEEEETQISGVKLLFDDHDMTTKHLLMPKDMMDFVEMTQTVNAGRQKGSYVVNLPSIAHFLLDLVKGLLSEKLKSRLFIYHNWDELRASGDFNVKILPKELGGEKTEAEMMKDFESLCKEKWEVLTDTAKRSELDWTKVPIEKIKANTTDDGVIGSFRKLEID
jgi:CRAL/TRIO domain